MELKKKSPPVISFFIFVSYFATEISKTILCHNKKVTDHLACRGIITTNIFAMQIIILDSMFAWAKVKMSKEADDCHLNASLLEQWCL